MKVTAVRTYVVPYDLSATDWGPGKAWVLIRLETDAGIDGWGQAYPFNDQEHAVCLEIQKLSPLLDGMDPFCIKHFMTTTLANITGPGGGAETATAVAGIEVALWDIVGKAQDVPVHRLLGGPCRDRVGVYANCWSDVLRTPGELANFAAKQVELGFKAVKIYPFLYGNSVEQGSDSLTAVRDVIGPDIDLFVDMWSGMREQDLPRILETLQAHEVSWFEDPAAATNVEALARIRGQATLPVISGETLYLKQDFRRLLEQAAADTLNPDVHLCGILGVTEIATIADAFSASVSVHNNNTMTIGLAAALQAAAVIPNLRLVEYFSRFVEGSNTFSSFATEMDDGGCLRLSREPGIGVVVDEGVVADWEIREQIT